MATSEKREPFHHTLIWVSMICLWLLVWMIVNIPSHRERELTARVTALESREGQASGN